MGLPFSIAQSHDRSYFYTATMALAFTPFWINLYTAAKLPSAWLAGVRVHSLSNTECETRVRHRWINQNPFQSMYFAVQAMAAEMSTGLLLIAKIRESGQPVSMLVANNRAHFSKKARGRLRFRCTDGAALEAAVREALASGEGRTVWVRSEGRDESGDLVSSFEFEWTVRGKAG